MCNAFNHPPGCACGWGGVWYGGNSDEGNWLFNREPRPRKLGRQRGTYDNPSGGLTVPNSKCPVCGASVFYYESPYGGRVFFDDLGPPWPKHPCTSGSNGSIATTKPQPWQKESWKALSSVSIDESKNYSGVYAISGTNNHSQYKFYFSAEEIVMAEIVRYRPAKLGQFEVSILDYNTTNTDWLVWSGVLFTDEKKAAASTPVSKSVIHTHQNERIHNTKPGPAEQPRLLQCPDCQSKLSPKNYLKHLLVQHKYIPLGSMEKITGRFIVS
jgi:hypothetical protein